MLLVRKRHFEIVRLHTSRHAYFVRRQEKKTDRIERLQSYEKVSNGYLETLEKLT